MGSWLSHLKSPANGVVSSRQPWNVWSARDQTLAVGSRRRQFPDQELPGQLEARPSPPSRQHFGHPGNGQVGTFVCVMLAKQKPPQHSTIVRNQLDLPLGSKPTESFTLMPK